MTTFAVTDENDILPALNYVLSNLDLGGGGGNGNANIPGNVIVANTQSGIITNYGNTSNAAPYWFLYQFINLRYANSATGTGFNTVSSNANYFGTYNSTTTTPSSNPLDYTWTEVAGGFGTANTIYYSAIGGRQVVWVATNSPPSSSFVQSTPNVAIDLDVVTTAAGTPGERGPVSMAYIVTTSDPNFATTSTLSAWFSASPAGPTAPIGTGLNPPVLGDIATFTYAAGVGKPTATYQFNGSIWQPAYAQRIDGNVIVQGTLAANSLVANSITATQIATGSLTTDLFTANTINGNIITVNTLDGNVIIGNTIYGNSIIANSFDANTINGNSLVIGSVTNTQIANGTITTNQIQANTITATNIAVGANITGNQIAANTISAINLVANTLTANTVVSEGATLNSYTSQGFWLSNTGNARFGNIISIGNLLTVGNNANIGTGANIGNNSSLGFNLTVGGNANIGANLRVGTNANIGNNLFVASNANIGNNLVVASNATIGNNLIILNNARIGNNANIGNFVSIGANLSVGGNISIGNNATIGNSLRIGSNANIGNNAIIGGNLQVTGLILTSQLIANTVATNNLIANCVSNGNSYRNNGGNIQIFANANQSQFYSFVPAGISPPTIGFNPNGEQLAIYVWGGGDITNLSWTQTNPNTTITFTARLMHSFNQFGSPGDVISTATISILSPGTGTQFYGDSTGQSPLTFSFPGFSYATFTSQPFAYFYIDVSYTANGPISFMNAWTETGSILGQMLKR